MHKTSEALQWRQMMLDTLRDAQHHLAVAEGNASVKVRACCSVCHVLSQYCMPSSQKHTLMGLLGKRRIRVMGRNCLNVPTICNHVCIMWQPHFLRILSC